MGAHTLIVPLENLYIGPGVLARVFLLPPSAINTTEYHLEYTTRTCTRLSPQPQYSTPIPAEINVSQAF